jgi:hypothetical protein
MKRVVRHVIARWAPERCNVQIHCTNCDTQESTVSVNPVDVDAKIARFWEEHRGCPDPV